MRKNVFTVIYLMLAALLLVGPHSFFAVCEVREKPMSCFYTTRAVAVLAVLLSISALLLLTADSARARIIIHIQIIALAMAVILLPAKLIGGCAMKSMACQSRTFPAFYFIAAFYIILSIIQICIQVKANEKKQ